MYIVYMKTVALPTLVSNNSRTNTPTEDPAIKSVEEMGYSRQEIDTAITILRRGKRYSFLYHNKTTYNNKKHD